MSVRLRTSFCVATALFLVVGAGVLDMVMDAGTFRSIEPIHGDRCERVEGVLGAEDLVFDREARRVYLSSADFRGLAAGKSVSGGIHVWDLDGSDGPVKVQTDLEGPLNAHGLSLFRSRSGKVRLFVVNHPDRRTSTVEIFEVDGPTSLRHVVTVAGPEMVSINDVAAVDERRFYATNDGSAPNDTLIRMAETFLRLPWSNVVWYDGEQLSVVAEGLIYGNGISLSQDRRTVFVTESTGHRVVAYARERDNGGLTRRADVQISTGLDNISIDPMGRLWIGAHPRMLDFLAHAADPAELSPSQVIVLDPRTNQVDEIFVDDGGLLSGSSVALPVGGGRVLIGSVFETHLLDCRFER